ncbi:conserved hypothetical protein [Streptococcus equi subsp. zooepidemicus ATCC 35246]|nr:conserved hypothetical protein [Streptococcus equi subsp. zooepidemicus ATCC 35246]
MFKPACLINGLLKRVKKAGAAWAQLFCSLEGFNLYELLFYYGFEPVFLVEKNKKTTSIAGG